MGKTLPIILLLFLSSDLFASGYKLSNTWPIGIGSKMYTLSEGEKKECLNIGRKLQLFDNLNTPIYCGVTSRAQRHGIDIPKWKEYDVEESFEILRQFDIKINEKIKRGPRWANRSESFGKVKTNIKNGRNIARSATIAISENKNISLTQNINGKCNDNKISHFRTNFSYKNDKNDFALITGIGNPVDIFILNDKTYLAGYYEREWDDSHKYKFNIPQLMIYVYKFNKNEQSNEIYYGMLCRFIYDKNQPN